MVHRLDYGSVRIEWGDPRLGNDSEPVKVRMTCVCGTQFCGRGAKFAEANRNAHEQFEQHLVFIENQGEPDDTRYGECGAP